MICRNADNGICGKIIILTLIDRLSNLQNILGVFFVFPVFADYYISQELLIHACIPS